jgi:DNA processing protein
LHPDRVRDLMIERGSAASVVRGIGAGSVRTTDRVRAAVAVDAAVRRSQLEALGVAFVAKGQSGYPEHLARFPDAPDALFVRGELPMTPAVAVVGTRRCTTYGKRLAAAYGRAIGEAGWCLVSGLARGIDGAAHEGTVAAGARGVGVLGCGIDVAYPPEHAILGRRLLDLGGAIVTEYPPGTPPEGWRFPPRNRIISGLAAAVIVVEAGVKGGALITAGSALTQGVPVFAVPGDVGRDSSQGTNLLIRDGAHPVLDADDLIAELELILGPVERSPAANQVPAEVGPVLAALDDGASADELAARLGMGPVDLVRLIGRLVAGGWIAEEGDLLVPAAPSR